MNDQSSQVLRHTPFCRLQLNRRAPKITHHRRARCLLPRQGAATVEFALVSPIIFLIVLALIQFAGLIMSQNVLTAAAREGGRVASMPSTIADGTVIVAVRDRLRRGGLNPGPISISIDTAGPWAQLNSGDKVTVSVSGAMSDMSWIGAVSIIPNMNLSADLCYERE